jgi:hypothetical protein
MGSGSHSGKSETWDKLSKQLEEFDGYIRDNRDFIPNYGERYRCGERISMAFAESTMNQVVSKRMVKKQQMAWTERGAHFLLPGEDTGVAETWKRRSAVGTRSSGPSNRCH